MTKATPDDRIPDDRIDESPAESAVLDAEASPADAALFADVDPSPDDGVAPVAAEPPTPDTEALTMLLEDARARADQTHDQLLRARAEMENMARRQAKELENAHKYALDNFVRELLPVRDSLELGLSAAAGPQPSIDRLREGTELTLKLFGDAMGKFGVERIDPEGQPFDPAFHQAMSMQPRGDVPPNTVVAVVQSGYLLNGRLVRPALVMVSQAG